MDRKHEARPLSYITPHHHPVPPRHSFYVITRHPVVLLFILYKPLLWLLLPPLMLLFIHPPPHQPPYWLYSTSRFDSSCYHPLCFTHRPADPHFPTFPQGILSGCFGECCKGRCFTEAPPCVPLPRDLKGS